MRGGESFGAVNFTDPSFDACRVSEGAEELVGGEVGEPDSIHAAALPEYEFAGEEGEHGIADPCGFAFDFECFVAVHARSLQLGIGVGEPFQTFAGDSLPQAILRFRVPVAVLQL